MSQTYETFLVYKGDERPSDSGNVFVHAICTRVDEKEAQAIADYLQSTQEAVWYQEHLARIPTDGRGGPEQIAELDTEDNYREFVEVFRLDDPKFQPVYRVKRVKMQSEPDVLEQGAVKNMKVVE